jgi:hypothetical protein
VIGGSVRGWPFAVVLFLIFASGLASGNLFPIIPSQDNVQDVKTFFTNVQPKSTIDWENFSFGPLLQAL